MSSLIIILFLVGIALVLIEVAVPGAILGLIGGVCLIVACAMVFHDHGVMAGSGAVAATLALLAVGLFIEFRLIPRSRFGKRLFLSAVVTGQSGSGATNDRLIGQTGETVTPLGPSGLVIVDGRKFEAVSRSGFIEQGVPVVVRGSDTFKLIVEKS